MKYDLLDVTLGICLLSVVAAFLMGKATLNDVAWFMTAAGLKLAPSPIK